MLVKTFIQRKTKPGKEKEFMQLLVELRTRAMKVQGFISGETLESLEDPAIHMTVGTWKSVADWNNWHNSNERKEVQEKLGQVLAEPPIENIFHYV